MTILLHRKGAWSNAIQMSTRYGKRFWTIILVVGIQRLPTCIVCIHMIQITIKSFPRVWQYRLMYSATRLATSRVILAYCILFLAVPETPEWDINSFSITHNELCKTRHEHTAVFFARYYACPIFPLRKWICLKSDF